MNIPLLLYGFLKTADDPASIGYAPTLANNAEEITDAAMRRPIGRVVANSIIPYGYSPNQFNDLITGITTREGWGNILTDTPPDIETPFESPATKSEISELSARRTLLRNMFGMPPQENTGSISNTGKNKWSLNIGTDFEIRPKAFTRQSRMPVIGGYAKSYNPESDTLKYRDFWDVAPNEDDTQGISKLKNSGNPDNLKEILYRQKANKLRTAMDVVTKTPVVEGEIPNISKLISEQGGSVISPEQLAAKIPNVPLPTYNSNAKWYKKDLGQLLADTGSKGVSLAQKLMPSIAPQIGSVASKLAPALGMAGKVIGPAGAAFGGAMELGNIQQHDPNLLKAFPKAMEANYRNNSMSENLNNPITAIASGVKNIYDTGKLKLNSLLSSNTATTGKLDWNKTRNNILSPIKPLGFGNPSGIDPKL